MQPLEPRSVGVFCGSKTGSVPAYEAEARRLGALIAKHDLRLVFGGDRRGLMGIVANAALAHGGQVTGVMATSGSKSHLINPDVEAVLVADRVERKIKMAELSGAFICLPGGLGTFDELFEMLTWSASGLHKKQCVIVNVDGYYDQLIGALDRATADQFVSDVNRRLLLVCTDSAKALAAVCPGS